VYGVFEGSILRTTFTGWEVDAPLGDEALRVLPSRSERPLRRAWCRRLVERHSYRRSVATEPIWGEGAEGEPFSAGHVGVQPPVADERDEPGEPLARRLPLAHRVQVQPAQLRAALAEQRRHREAQLRGPVCP